MKPAEINARLEIPEDTSYVSIKEEEAAFLFDFIREHGIQKTLETGLGYGRSAAHILAATGNKHIAIDPFQSDYEYLALKNIRDLGLEEHFEFIEDYSHNVLPWLLKEIEHGDDGEKFDLIFIDGNHTFDGILLDFYYADRLLKSGGFILFHDTWMRSTQLVSSFIRRNKPNYSAERTPVRNFLVFRKTGKDDGRNGMHFREFYNRKSRLRFALITWLLEPGNGLLKRSARWLKEKLR